MYVMCIYYLYIIYKYLYIIYMYIIYDYINNNNILIYITYIICNFYLSLYIA